MAENGLSPGDVLGFAIERIGRFGACQIVATEPEKQQVTVALLDWTGEQMPTLGDVADAPRLSKNFMFWREQEVVLNVTLPAPLQYQAIGTLPVRGSCESRSYGDWDFNDLITQQQWWNALPAELTQAFKASLDSDQSVTVAGLVHALSGEPMPMRISAALRFSDDAAYRINRDFCMAALRAWPALTKVHLHAWREDLVAFLRTSPLVYELLLLNHQQREIDLSGTHLDRLTINIDGLERLVLPKSLNVLVVHSAAHEAPACTQVLAEQDGRWISLQTSDAVPRLQGLEQLRGLMVSRVHQLDVADVAKTFPNIEHLHLLGAPGTLSGLEALPALPKLHALWLCDLFGYAAEAFPAPQALPSLTSLSLDSFPADVAATLRKVYKKAPQVELSLRKPRKPEWLQENLDNPLRHWDGREGIPPTLVKKTHSAFVIALRQVREAHASRVDEATYTEVVTRAITGFLEVVSALNRKRQFLYTLERDEVIGAVNLLAAQLSAQASVALDPLIEAALDD